MSSTPRATFCDDFFRFDYPDEEVSLLLERLAEKRGGGIQCELTIETAAMPHPGVLYSGNFNLLTSNKALANTLRERQNIDWDGILVQVAAVSKKRYREGDPLIDLAEVEPSQRSRWLMRGFVEDTTRPTLIAAGGGTGKSTIGVAAAATVATGIPFLGIEPQRQCSVLYMDWEADAEIHAERLQALWRGIGRDGAFPPGLVYYQRQLASLHESVATIRRRIAEEAIGFAVLDSVGMARGDDPNSAEATIRMFAANRKLGIPVLAIDHMSKEVLSKKTRATAIGSVYTENSVCRVWVMKGAEQPDGSIGLSLEDVKRNNTPRQRTLAYVMRYEDDGTEDQRPVVIRYDRTDFRDLPRETMPSGQSSQKWLMAKVIEENGGRPVPDGLIAEAMGISEKQVRALLSRHDDMFIRVDGQGIARADLERVE